MRSCVSVALLVSSLTILVGCSGSPTATTADGKPISYWLEALGAKDAKLRKTAAQKLGNIGVKDAQTVPALVAALTDRDAAVRAEAALALLRIGPAAKESLPALTQAQNDRDRKVRTYATKALESIRRGP